MSVEQLSRTPREGTDLAIILDAIHRGTPRAQQIHLFGVVVTDKETERRLRRRVSTTWQNLRREKLIARPNGETEDVMEESVSLARGGIRITIKPYMQLGMTATEIYHAIQIKDNRYDLSCQQIAASLSKARKKLRAKNTHQRTEEEQHDARRNSKTPILRIRQRVRFWLEARDLLLSTENPILPQNRIGWGAAADFVRTHKRKLTEDELLPALEKKILSLPHSLQNRREEALTQTYARENRRVPENPSDRRILAAIALLKRADAPLKTTINNLRAPRTTIQRLSDELSFLANPYPDEFLSILVQNGTAVPCSLDDRLFLLNFFKARCALKMGDPSVLGTFNDIYEESFFQRFSGEIELIRNNTVNPSENRVVPINAMAEPGESKSWSSWDS